jgi:hypothetical protein
MAGYNMMIPYLVPEMPEQQQADLKLNVKAPLVYTNVVVKNWQAFKQLGVHEFYSPAAPYSRVKLDYPVSIGGYQHPASRTIRWSFTWSMCRPIRAVTYRPESSSAWDEPICWGPLLRRMRR